MKMFATSDIHGNKAVIHELVQAFEESNADLLLVCGDIGGKYYSTSLFSRFSEN